MQRVIFDNWGLKEHVGTIHYEKKEERNMKQAGAELCQAQLSLG